MSEVMAERGQSAKKCGGSRNGGRADKERAARRMIETVKDLVSERTFKKILDCFESPHCSQDARVLCVMKCLNNFDPCLSKRCVLRVQNNSEEVYEKTRHCICNSIGESNKRSLAVVGPCGEVAKRRRTEDEDAPCCTEMKWFSACRRDDLKEMQLIVEQHPNIIDALDKTSGKSALMCAAQFGLEHTVSALLSWGASLNVQDSVLKRSAIGWAIHGNQIPVVKLLLQASVDPNQVSLDGLTPLHHACRNGQEEIADLLISGGADFEKTDERGLSPLLFASMFGHSSIVVMLKQHGACLHGKDKSGCTAFLLAARAGRVKAAMTLLELGSSADARDCNGCTALHLAARAGHADMLKALLASPALCAKTLLDSVCSVRGNTPLMLAAQFNRGACVDVLLAHGANIHLKNFQGFNALQLANREGAQDAITSILAALQQ